LSSVYNPLEGPSLEVPLYTWIYEHKLHLWID